MTAPTFTETHDGPLFAEEPCPYDCVSCSAGLILNEPDTARLECRDRRGDDRCPYHSPIDDRDGPVTSDG